MSLIETIMLLAHNNLKLMGTSSYTSDVLGNQCNYCDLHCHVRRAGSLSLCFLKMNKKKTYTRVKGNMLPKKEVKGNKEENIKKVECMQGNLYRIERKN